MSDLVVCTTDLTKRYRHNILAVDRLNLRVAAGEIYAFLGLNGAGKSTTIRMLLGMIAPTSGHVELFGEPVRADAANIWRRVGHLVDAAIAYPELTVRENLEVARCLRAVVDPVAVGRAIAQLDLGVYADRRAGILSQGNLQRLGLARALLHQPRLLVLDEPTNGLDPAGVIEVRELLRALAHQHGVTVFTSSHILPEVDRLATRVGIVHHGRLIEELDTPALELHRDQRLEIGARHLDIAQQVLHAAGFAPRRRLIQVGDVVLELREQRAIDEPEAVVALLVEGGALPTRLALTREMLEDNFIRVTREADDDAAA